MAGNVDHNFNSVNCHSCILVSAIPQLFDIMKNAFEVFDEDAIARIYFPGFSYTDLKLFIVSTYIQKAARKLYNFISSFI